MTTTWLGYADIAALMGLSPESGARTVASWRARGLPRLNPLPPPDRERAVKGHVVPEWREPVIREWLARRPGKGGRPPAA